MFKKFYRPSFAMASMMIIAMLFWLAGCSDSSTPSDGGEDDTTPPALLSVTPQNAYQITVVFDESVDQTSAQYRPNYGIYRQMIVLGAPDIAKSSQSYGDTLYIVAAALLPDAETVLLTVEPSMQAGEPYQIVVQNVKDLHGNAMTTPDSSSFTGSASGDITPPEIVQRSPMPGAGGVGIGQSVIVTFSEPMNWNSVLAAFSWTKPGGSVNFEMHNDGNIYSFIPTQPLSYGTQYTVGFAAGTATDWNNNELDASSWFFTTTSVIDETPPTVVSTVPANGAVNVPLGANLQITFSEAIDPASTQQGGIMLTPEPGEGVDTWSNNGKTITFNPDSDLLPATVYTLTVLQGGIRDYAGNVLAQSYTATFTTGSSLPTGGFSGTIDGDAASLDAVDPEGALVIASLVNMFDYSGEGPPPIAGSDVVDQNGHYAITHLEDGEYWPFAIMDSNDDGELNPEEGDAIGIYGVDFTSGPMIPEADSVVVAGGTMLPGIDFGLYDPIAISGMVVYSGSTYSGSLENLLYYVGVFDAATFDTTGGLPDPDYADEDYIAWDPYFLFSQFENGLQDGSYYVGAYLDVNLNVSYDPGVDPANFYSVGGEWTPVTVQNGRDALDLVIYLMDPPAGSPIAASAAGGWTMPEQPPVKHPELQKMIRLMTQALENRHPGSRR